METQPEPMPEGWTNDPHLLDIYFSPETREAHMARCCGLEDAELVLMGTPESGEMHFIITAGGKFYWGHFMIDYLGEITRPKTFPEILHVLGVKGLKGLRMKYLEPVWTYEEEEEEEEEEGGPRLFVPVDPDAP
ncbi:hypothetical protein BO99DRAFT_433783 [Aspergillus violaceofuscus CBS 115571]|uniref:Uncharacterized protein n=1 Tax=Aspergillus violaceofuscus (strain CBS 115571) TaxID=1450538 RepID=A0A2V5H2K5_ASPV1|nr:hypothetical protein BO99DRAFT_433783 [Aspergillus violaceofuscus CBS 115571]